MHRLAESVLLSARALELTILTGCRSGEILEAPWEEFDLEEKLWVLPANRTKQRRIHRVPLTNRMLAILLPLHKTRISQYVFPGQKPGRPLSNMAMELLMKRMKVTGATPHGFRSFFRDWAGDCTDFSWEVAEGSTAHKVGGSTEIAYRRGDALDKRRQLMEAWGQYCSGFDEG